MLRAERAMPVIIDCPLRQIAHWKSPVSPETAAPGPGPGRVGLESDRGRFLVIEAALRAKHHVQLPLRTIRPPPSTLPSWPCHLYHLCKFQGRIGIGGSLRPASPSPRGLCCALPCCGGPCGYCSRIHTHASLTPHHLSVQPAKRACELS